MLCVSGTSRCGGSLVNEWYVVTAGHCVARARPEQVRVTLGEYVLKANDEPLPGRTYGASEIKVHPYFKFTPQADRFDVAVVRLNRRVDMAPHISPLCLPPKGMNMYGVHGWAAGWGALQPGSRLRPKTLQVLLTSANGRSLLYGCTGTPCLYCPGRAGTTVPRFGKLCHNFHIFQPILAIFSP